MRRLNLSTLRASWRIESSWPEPWFDQLAKKYQTPPPILRRVLTHSDLIHEMAVMLAESVKEAAKALADAAPAERVRKRQSKDWFDRLVVERYRLDEAEAAKREKAP